MGEATIRDVARRAQVSVASVSRALNGLKNVGAETREKVLAAASELGYVPHAGARSLSLARAHAIGVVLPDLHGEFFSEIVRGMDKEASERGYLLLLSNMHSVSDQAAAALAAMRGRVDGLLVMAPHIEAEALAKALPRALPAVLINTPGGADGRPTVGFDNHAGVDAMIRHLAENGHRRILHISGPEDNIDAQQRAEAFRTAMGRYVPGMPAAIAKGDFSKEAGEAVALRILNGEGDYDAVFAANDMMAIGCLQTLKAGGMDVPGKMAVAGFDDIPIARYLDLTTVRVRIEEIGARAVIRLIDLFEGRGEPGGCELYTPELVVRETTAPRPS